MAFQSRMNLYVMMKMSSSTENIEQLLSQARRDK